MNRTEIKEQLKDIIRNTEYTIKNLRHKKDWLNTAIQKIEDLNSHLNEYVEDALDQEELIRSISNEIFISELEEIYDAVEELRHEITSYADELSESKTEDFLERFEDLEIVSEKFNQSNSEYEDIDNAIEHLEEAIVLLKNMV